MSLLVPASWNWQRDAAGFYEQNHYVFLALAVSYYPVVFGLRYFMKNKTELDLGGAKSSAALNYVFWWELALSVFSGIAAWHVVPTALEPIWAGSSWAATICGPGVHDDPRSFWAFLFMVSKVFEFGDTIFIVLRKKDLVVLQHYHHLCTMLYCWYGTLFIFPINNTNSFFAGMNLCVHTVMYAWYAACRTGWRSPVWVMMGITVIQISQMIGGIAIIATAVFGPEKAGCGKWLRDDWWGAAGAGFMYFSYFVLFGKLFVDNYICKKKRSGKKDKKTKQG